MCDLKDIDEKPVKAVDSVENGPALSPSNGLTGIHQGIHWPATQEPVEAEYHELDRIAIEAFLDALADVAISIAAREHSEKKDQERYS